MYAKIKRYAASSVVPIIFVNLLLALVAMVRDVLFASYLGTTAQADALLLAFFLPNTVGNNLMFAAIVVGCVPVFSRLSVLGDSKRLHDCYINTTLLFSVAAVLIAALFFASQEAIINIIGSDLPHQTRALAQNLFLIILPVLLFFPFAATGSALLQVRDRFTVTAFVPVLYNGVYLGGVLLALLSAAALNYGVYLIAWSILAAVVSMAALVGIWLGKTKTGWDLRTMSWEYSDILSVLKTLTPYLLILLSTQCVLYVEMHLATRLGTGVIAGLNYAYRLSQFPIWVFVAAVGMVVLPAMSKASGAGNIEGLKETFAKAMRLVLVLSLPLAIMFFVLRVPIVSILLQRGAFDAGSLLITTGILAGYSLAIVGQAFVYIMIRTYLALLEIVLPLIISFIAAAFNIALDIYLVGRIGWAGLGYGAAAGASFNALVLLVFLNKKLNLSLQQQYKNVVKILLANIPVVFIALIAVMTWGYLPQDVGPLIQALYVVVVVAAFLASYLLSLRHFKIL